MAEPQPISVFAPKLYKTYFDDATLSDLTIKLSDRSVRVHRIVLCRQSEYFSKLLTGQFQESRSKEIELKEDDPASLVALLRFIYDLPYDEGFETDRLVPHAMVYAVADKYQVTGLDVAVSNKMKHILDSSTAFEDDSDSGIRDFLEALEIIVTHTTIHDKHARGIMVKACTRNLPSLRRTPTFLSLLRQSADLGAEIIGHDDLQYGLAGDWVCAGQCEFECRILCRGCGVRFGREFSWQNRDNKYWTCESCEHYVDPKCAQCDGDIEWRYRGLE